MDEELDMEREVFVIGTVKKIHQREFKQKKNCQKATLCFCAPCDTLFEQFIEELKKLRIYK
jgi:hypothetical protein